MTEEQSKKAIGDVFAQAVSNSLIYGVGFVRIMMTPNGEIDICSIDRDDFMEMADCLSFLDKHCLRETKQ
jgi:hypothetical protein